VRCRGEADLFAALLALLVTITREHLGPFTLPVSLLTAACVVFESMAVALTPVQRMALADPGPAGLVEGHACLELDLIPPPIHGSRQSNVSWSYGRRSRNSALASIPPNRRPTSSRMRSSRENDIFQVAGVYRTRSTSICAGRPARPLGSYSRSTAILRRRCGGPYWTDRGTKVR
jgi:hypothetical protein